jgi:predicted RNase H-like HicB family nuclease
MYDIKIFIEDDWKYWARINAWKEIIYWVWNSQKELMENIRQWLEFSFDNKKRSQNVSKLFEFIN